ncbi:transmembrane protein 199-like [Ostrea edulis]|uniref:transmembrane protein 199-like n=1 Tax=Ostrea edulis TaxID=37623 RepID=UPI0020944E84|nr:transmembrane protein 199-like [Ostrea edulis]
MEPDVTLTNKLRSKLASFREHDNSSTQSKEIQAALNNEETKSIPFRLIRYAFDRHQSKGSTEEYLNEWLDGSALYLPAYEPPLRNPELETRIQRLKAEQANREYKEMVRSVDKEQKAERERFGAEVKAMNSHIWSVVNFIVTVGGAFAFGYKATEYTFSGGNTFVAQMVAGLIFATVVFFADLYFMVKQIS